MSDSASGGEGRRRARHVLIGDEGSTSRTRRSADPLAFVQGPLDFASSNFRIQPRSPSDIAFERVAWRHGSPETVARTSSRQHAEPVNPATAIRFALPQTRGRWISRYTTLGRPCAALARGDGFGGDHTMAWTGGERTGKELSSGVYLVRFEAGTSSRRTRITLMK